jgi:hypothetical protein
MEREDKKNILPEEEYLDQMSSMPKVKAPDDFLKKVHERIERRSALEKIMRALFVPVKIKVPLEVAAMAATVILIVSTVGIKKPMEQRLSYAPQTEIRTGVLMKNETVAGKKMAEAESGERGAVRVFANRGYTDSDLTDNVSAPLSSVSAPPAENKPVEIALLVSAEKKDKARVAGESAEIYSFDAMRLERRPYLDEVFSKVKNQVELAQGKVTNVEMDKDTGMPQYIDAEIPATGYAGFMGNLSSIGTLHEPILKEASQGQGTVRLRIKLISK